MLWHYAKATEDAAPFVNALRTTRSTCATNLAYERGAITSHAQPTRKQRPPMGVIAPSHRIFVSAITYRLPLKTKMPAKSNHHALRFVPAKSARTRSARA